MTMSSSKAAVLSAASASYQITFDKYLEIRAAEEIDEVLLTELRPPTGDLSGSTTASSTVSTHAKPQRPGRGRAKVSKFTADEN